MEIAKVAEQAAVTAQTAPKTSVQTSTEKAKSTLTADNADKYVKSEDTFTPHIQRNRHRKKRLTTQTGHSSELSHSQRQTTLQA